jgi:uncharacterized membrane protein YadS
MNNASTRFAAASLFCFIALRISAWVGSISIAPEAQPSILLASGPSLLGAMAVTFLARAIWPSSQRAATIAAVVLIVMVVWEVVQAFPPVNTLRTFDWNDVWATVLGVVLATFIASRWVRE